MNPAVFLVAIPVLVALAAGCNWMTRPKVRLSQLLLLASLLSGVFLLVTVSQSTTVSAIFASGLQNVDFGLSTDLLKTTLVCLVLIATLVLLTKHSQESPLISLSAFAAVLAIFSGTTTTLLAALCVALLSRLLSPGVSATSILLSSAAIAVWFGTCVSVLNLAKTTSFAEIFAQEVSGTVAFFWALAALLWLASLLTERVPWVAIFALAGSITLIDNLNDVGVGTQNNVGVVLVGAAGCLLAVWGLRGTWLGVVVAGFALVTEEVAVAGTDAADILGLVAVSLLALAVVAGHNRWLPWRVAACSCALLLLSISYAVSYSVAVTSQQRYWLVPILGLSGIALVVIASGRLRGFLAAQTGETVLAKGLISGAAGVALACWAVRLVQSPGLNSFDFLSVNSVGDGFAFGYLALTLMVLAVLLWAVLVLVDVRALAEDLPIEIEGNQPWLLSFEGRLEGGRVVGVRLFARIEEFLVGQPKLATVVVAVIVYLVLVR